jgi:hypothetical protein
MALRQTGCSEPLSREVQVLGVTARLVGLFTAQLIRVETQHRFKAYLNHKLEQKVYVVGIDASAKWCVMKEAD